MTDYGYCKEGDYEWESGFVSGETTHLKNQCFTSVIAINYPSGLQSFLVVEFE